MKLCPQCDFIYEDDQNVCDMDGKELVSSPERVVADQDSAPPVSPTPNPDSEIPAIESARRRWLSFAVATVVGVFLAALIIVVYLARTHQASGAESSGAATDQSAAPSTAGANNGQPPATDLVSTQTPATDAALPNQSPEQSSELSAAQANEATANAAVSPSSAKESLAHTRLTASPVSASASAANSRGPVIVRLTNGSSIVADEAWEKREGVWYRQGGVVTFLKRSQVRTIERTGLQPAKSNDSKVQSRKTQNTANRNQPGTAQLETAKPKKQSRLSSFFKKTGQVLKKPFKL